VPFDPPASPLCYDPAMETPESDEAESLLGIVTLRGSERHLFSRSENSHAAAAASHQVFMAEARSVRCVRAEVRWR